MRGMLSVDSPAGGRLFGRAFKTGLCGSRGAGPSLLTLGAGTEDHEPGCQADGLVREIPVSPCSPFRPGSLSRGRGITSHWFPRCWRAIATPLRVRTGVFDVTDQARYILLREISRPALLPAEYGDGFL